LNDELLRTGLEHAKYQLQHLEVELMGGPIDLHYDAGWARMQEWAREKPWVKCRLWPEQGEFLSRLRDCHVGVWLDRDGVEPLFGSRTRALLFGWMGLEVVGSPQTELAKEMAESGLLHPVTDAWALTDTLVRMAKTGESPENAQHRQQRLMEMYAPSICYDPLINWVASPRIGHQVSGGQASLVAENNQLKTALRSIHDSPTWRLSAQVKRWINH
jgi:hypothetical protein